MMLLQKILEEALVDSEEFRRLLQGSVDVSYHADIIVKEMMKSKAMKGMITLLEKIYKGEKDVVKHNNIDLQ